MIHITKHSVHPPFLRGGAGPSKNYQEGGSQKIWIGASSTDHGHVLFHLVWFDAMENQVVLLFMAVKTA